MSVTIPLILGGSALVGSLIWASRQKDTEEDRSEEDRSEGLPPPNPPPVRQNSFDFALTREGNKGEYYSFDPADARKYQLAQDPQARWTLDAEAVARSIREKGPEWKIRSKSAFPVSDISGAVDLYQDKHGYQKLPVVKASRVIERVQKGDTKVLTRLFGSKDIESKPWQKTDVVAIRIETWDEFRWFGKLLAGVLLTYSFAPKEFKKLGFLDWVSFFRYHQFLISDPLKTSMENEYRKRLYRPKRPGETFSRDHYFARGTKESAACPDYSAGPFGGERKCWWNKDSSLPEGGWYECDGNEWCYPQEFEFLNKSNTSKKRPLDAFITASPVWLIAEFAATFFYQTAFLTLVLPQNQKNSLIGPLIQSIAGAIGSSLQLAGGIASQNSKVATQGGVGLTNAILMGIMVGIESGKIRENTELARSEIENRIESSLSLLQGVAPSQIQDFSGYVMGAIVPPWIDHHGWQGEERYAEYISKTKKVYKDSEVRSWDKDIVDNLQVAEGGYLAHLWEGPTYLGNHHWQNRWYDGSNENNGPFGYLNDPLATYFALG